MVIEEVQADMCVKYYIIFFKIYFRRCLAMKNFSQRKEKMQTCHKLNLYSAHEAHNFDVIFLFLSVYCGMDNLKIEN